MSSVCKVQDGDVSSGRDGSRSSLDPTSGFIVDVPGMKLRRIHDRILEFYWREDNGKFLQALIKFFMKKGKNCLPQCLK